MAARALALRIGPCLLALSYPFRAEAAIDARIFGHVDFGLERDDAGNVRYAFQVPELDLFATANGGRWSFLGEIDLEYLDTTLTVDLERVEVGYQFFDAFRVRAGRFHTALGYYNDAYHHGDFFLVSTDRPLALQFEDEGGLFPSHAVGLHFDGRVGLGTAGKLRYDAELANGRGMRPDEVTNVLDPNRAKAFNLRLRFEPAWPAGLLVGGQLYRDDIRLEEPESRQLVEWIGGGHLAYLEAPLHFIAELAVIHHRDDAAAATFQTLTGSVEAAYLVWGGLRPYLRYERVSAPASPDPFFASGRLARLGSFHAVTLGLNWSGENVALKLEGQRVFSDQGGNFDSLTTQCAFGF
ncbi:MAG: hypothetical protein ACOZIN_01535 [Myxococcota bacterium]